MLRIKKSQPSTSSIQPSPAFRHFPLSEILKATNNFDESLIIGRGGFGDVYGGKVFNGTSVVPAAIKRLKNLNPESSQGAMEFRAEVETPPTFRHRNLVPMIGYCNYEKEVKSSPLLRSRNPESSYQKEMILLYEYMPNGTLKDLLHKTKSPVSWVDRMNISICAGRGIHYLHTGTVSCVIHRDVKPSNILLDKNGVAKLSDYGLLKIIPSKGSRGSIFTYPKGTIGFMDPSYYKAGRLTSKSDVYSFGVVLLELLFRKPALDESRNDEHRNLVTWVQDSIKEMNLKDIIDSEIRDEISPECLNEVFEIAMRCVLDSPKERPNMSEVVDKLEHARELQMRFYNSVEGDSTLPSPGVKEFMFNGLEKATRGFSHGLSVGAGSNVNVFLGWVDKKTLAPSNHVYGIAVAVKRDTLEIPLENTEWLEKVSFLGQFAHPNIIRFLGCCNRDGREHLLVYEHMEKSLSDFIQGGEQLSWGKLVHIMIGVARAVIYLYSTKGVLCHFKCTDILLDEDFNAKIGSFGWAKHDTEREEIHDRIWLRGTFGYLKPDYCMTGHFMMTNDIYSFGLVLLETITGRPLAGKELKDLLERLERLVKRTTKIESYERKLKKIVDPRLKGSYPMEDAFKCITLALRCMAKPRENKPSREEILMCMEQINAANS